MAHERELGAAALLCEWVRVFLLCLSGLVLTGQSSARAEPVAGKDDGMVVAPHCRVRPYYPDQAHARGLQGYVLLRFDIEARGKTKNIEIISSAPAKVFDRAARRIVSRLCYHPAQDAASPNQIVWHDVHILILYYLDRGCKLEDRLEEAAKAHIAAQGIQLADDITTIIISGSPPSSEPSYPCTWFTRRKKANH